MSARSYFTILYADLYVIDSGKNESSEDEVIQKKRKTAVNSVATVGDARDSAEPRWDEV